MTALEREPLDDNDHSGGGVVIPFPRHEQERKDTLTSAEQAFVSDFYNFAANPEEYRWPYESEPVEDDLRYLKAEDELQPVDPETKQFTQARKMALAVHRFCARTGHDAVLDRELRITEGQALPKLYTIPEPAITWRIQRYYRDFGTERLANPTSPEQGVFLRQQSAIHSVVYDAHRSNPSPRYLVYPELGYTIVLRQLMERLGNQVAADSAEVVLAAYGNRFMERALRAGQQVMAARQHAGE